MQIPAGYVSMALWRKSWVDQQRRACVQTSGLLQQLAIIDREPSDKEPMLDRLVLLRQRILSAEPKDRALIVTSLRELRREVDKMKDEVRRPNVSRLKR